MNNMNRHITLFIALLVLTATAFSMGCTETADEENAGEVIEEEGIDNQTEEETASEQNRIQGTIIFDEPVESFSNATIYLKVEDVSLQDVSSIVVAEDIIVSVSQNAGDIHPVSYSINYPQLEERMTYSLSAHVDVDGDGSLSNGDYYSTWHNPVPTESGVHELDVHVEMI
jgi:uncharacterized lipoprotein YbaY